MILKMNLHHIARCVGQAFLFLKWTAVGSGPHSHSPNGGMWMLFCLVHVIEGASVKRLVFSPLIVEVHPAADALACALDGVVGVEVDLLVF